MGDTDKPDKQQTAEAFVKRWAAVSGSERANYQLFITELCALLGVPSPEPAHEAAADNAYVFERRVSFAHGDGSASVGFVDCYKRGAFVLEAKKLRQGSGTKGFDEALLRARSQAEAYARALPAAEGRPPFVVVVDVGQVIELYAEFTRSGATYTPFPDARSHRLPLAALHDAATRQRLRTLWQDPMALDPARASAKVTREVAAKLAALARDLEAAGHAAQPVAAFLTRCLFCMFAEDVGLLPKSDDGRGAFQALLQTHRDHPDTLRQMLRVLWMDMDRGGFSPALAREVLRFNGKLFKGHGAADYVLPLTRAHIEGLLDAAASNWREVEPAIFGTLLERALDPDERHALGAHYTPRAYVERLVLPTVVEPLRADWANAQAAALLLATEAAALQGRKHDDKLAEARAEIKRFHHQLCTTRVLDPACGSGNFLYVTLEHLKRLEGEVLAQAEALGDTQSRLGFAGETVTPQQLLGIEINERAAALAELVLWIGYLQWHIRSFGHTSVAEPVIHDYGNIEHRDAVLAYDGQEPLRDAAGNLVQRWDGKSFKTHPVTGEQVPDETALVPQWRYLNPRAAEWPRADFIVGNPPFIGNKRMRDALGDGYVEALREVGIRVPDTSDFVMFWWDHAAELVRQGSLRRFGLITTNSLRQTFNRGVVEHHLRTTPPLRLRLAVPDHPWVDSASRAAVRIAMTVGTGNDVDGELWTVARESEAAEGEVAVAIESRGGVVHSDLTVGPAVGRAVKLVANAGLCFQGMNLVGKGFRLDAGEVRALGYDPLDLPDVIKPHGNARDLLQGADECFVIDFFGLSGEQARGAHPSLYQRLFDRVKPERDLNADPQRQRDWWLFGRSNAALRSAWVGLQRLILTAETAKHRIFVFRERPFCPDHKLYAVCSDDALLLGVLSSGVHASWALRAGGTLEDRPTWTNTTTFLPFPFPSDDTGLTPELTTRIRALAEQLDTHRKTQQAAHPGLTLTGIYNVLEKLRSGGPLSAKEKVIHAQGLVSVLKSLHADLDAAVLAAYGWQDLQAALADHRQLDARAAAVEALLERLVALNAKRAAEEAAGTVRWLRPDLQQRSSAAAQQRMDVDTEAVAEAGAADDAPTPAATAAPPVPRHPWPSGLPEQIKAVADVLAASPRALTLADLEQCFSARGRWRERLPTILRTLEALGRARRSPQADVAAPACWQAA
ncbi:MAG: class I SAM-dependent DNA methyltransferase [Rubrivivax sp.]|nr:class I SAM-dependent DNA methyltransferase [Rubrivivax sp.]